GAGDQVTCLHNLTPLRRDLFDAGARPGRGVGNPGALEPAHRPQARSRALRKRSRSRPEVPSATLSAKSMAPLSAASSPSKASAPRSANSRTTLDVGVEGPIAARPRLIARSKAGSRGTCTRSLRCLRWVAIG